MMNAATRFALAAQLTLFALSSPAHAQAFSADAPGFTAEQADRGKAAYAANCVMCHGEGLNGSAAGPSLTGTVFQTRWHDLRPAGLYAFILGQMPPNAGGSLSNQTYGDLAAYLFEANGFTPGSVAFNPGAPGATPAIRSANRDAIYDAVMAQRRAKLDRITPVSDSMLRQPSEGDWLIWRRDYSSTAYSPLRQINRQNASRLKAAWSWSLPLSGNETTPLVHDGVIFIKSGNHVQALDGERGDLLWEYVRPYPTWMHDGATEIVKNLAIYENMLYVPFLDGHLVALDVKSGNVLWDHLLVGLNETAGRLPGPMDSSDAQHFRMVADGGPLLANGEVIVGLAGCSNPYKGGCFIVGLNAHTGDEDWRFHTIARPGEPGGDSWNGAPADERFGASVWFSGSYDPVLNLVYFGIGQTYKTSTLLMPQAAKGASNDALYTDSTVALVPTTGKLAWYYQHFNADIWDLDWAFEQTLVTLPVNGTRRNLVVTAGKIAIFDAIDRGNGRYEFSRSLGLQNIVEAIDPKTGRKAINPSFIPPPGTLPRFAAGGDCQRNQPFSRDEPSTAYDPVSHIMYVPIWNASCAQGTAKFDGQYGRLEAMNLVTGKVEWMLRQRAPEASSLLVTAGGLVFDGSMDRVFRAVDAATGKVLWQIRLNAAPKSAPVTYTVNGRQYIAVVAGGAVLGGSSIPTPELFSNPSNGETLWIFELPSNGTHE